MNQLNQHEIVVGERAGQDMLNVVCWEKVLDYLSFEDIRRISRTCKRLQQIGRVYIEDNLPINSIVKQAHWSAKGVLDSDWPEPFDRFKKLTLLTHDEPFELKIPLNFHMKEMLNNSESLELESCTIFGDLDDILKHCPNLRGLKLDNVKCCSISQFNNWLHRLYPELRSLALSFGEREPLGSQLTTFLERNPNVKRLQIDADFFWKIRQTFREANIHLDHLIIRFCSSDNSISIDEFVNLLNELHEREFFKTFELDTDSQELINSLAPLNAFKALSIHASIDISHLAQLKELNFMACEFDTEYLENLARNLVNLKKIDFEGAGINDILPFARHSMKLHTVQAREYYSEQFSVPNAINLVLLNEERQRLSKPEKMFVYVDERSYLATKRHPEHLWVEHVGVGRYEMEKLFSVQPVDDADEN